MIAVHLRNMNEGAVITSVYHNSGPHNATVLVPQVGNSPSFAGVNFISPPMTPTVPHINHTGLGCGQN